MQMQKQIWCNVDYSITAVEVKRNLNVMLHLGCRTWFIKAKCRNMMLMSSFSELTHCGIRTLSGCMHIAQFTALSRFANILHPLYTCTHFSLLYALYFSSLYFTHRLHFQFRFLSCLALELQTFLPSNIAKTLWKPGPYFITWDEISIENIALIWAIYRYFEHF